jgi:hypothetical protein
LHRGYIVTVASDLQSHISRRNASPETAGGTAAEPPVPNEETIAAMREAREGKLPRFKNAKGLLRELNEDD